MALPRLAWSGFSPRSGDPLANPAIVGVLASISVGVGVWILGRFIGTAGGPADGMPNWSRRSFMIRAGGIGVGAIAAGLVGRGLLERQRSAPVGSGPVAPPASVTVPPLAADADLSTTVAGLTPIVMPNDRFYRIDTALLTPIVDTADWSLRIHGLVDRETTLTWDELIGLPMFEQYVTIACVSNESGRRPRRQRQMDRCPASRGARPGRRPGVGNAARGPIRGWLDGRDADGLGDGRVPRADDRAQDE